MAKYGKKAQEKVEEKMHEMKVKNPRQAIAIGLSEARREGGKVPRKRK